MCPEPVQDLNKYPGSSTVFLITKNQVHIRVIFKLRSWLMIEVRPTENNLTRSWLMIEVRPTENDLIRLYKNGDISVVITFS